MATLSRVYRPQTFAEVTGQDPIKETLRLEVQTGKLGHAYFFAGPRGVGKTTTARIFAKALNCLNGKDGEPCNACEACVEMNAGRSLDVIEMDAASNTGVDNVREAIVEHVRFTPTSRKYKVYILDEAHMLSTSAWNALLKTIEEPPAYAIFILVTTEVHKVPATILSRCQRFDFKRISESDLTTRLNVLIEHEKIQVAPEVVLLIVSKSDGCARDAESILGQLISLGETNITADIASLVLPLSRLPLAANVLAACSRRELGPALQLVAELEEQGIALLPLFDDVIYAIRCLLLAAESITAREKLTRGDEGERALAALVQVFQPAELSEMALLCMERRKDAKQGADVRFCLELAVTAIALNLLPHAPTTSVLPSIQSVQPVESVGGRMPCAPTIPMQSISPVGAQGLRPDPVPAPAPVPAPVPTPIPQPVPPSSSATAPAIRLIEVQQKWQALIRLVDEKSPSLTFVLKISKPIEVRGLVIVIRFQYAFHRDKVSEDVKARRIVEECLSEVHGVPGLRIEGVVGLETELPKEGQSRDMVTNILKAFEGQFVEGATEANPGPATV